MFTFSLLSPGENDRSFKASLLTFDNEHRILADPSWSGSDALVVKFMEQYLPSIDAIIISHSTTEFISGYILLCIYFPKIMLTIPVYSTLPVNQLGRISTVEYYRSQGVLGPVLSSLIELDEIDNWFDKFKTVKYLQNITLCDGKLTMTPYNSGHSLGGTFWLIVKRIDRVIYAPSWNHSRDSLLNNAGFINTQTGMPHVGLLRPTAFVTGADLGSNLSHKKRCEKFLQLVDATLNNGGAAIIPTSISGRFLELFHLVDQHLKGAPIPVYFFSYSGTKILSYASGLMDWMSSSFNKAWNMENLRDDQLPFNPSKVDLLVDPSELMQMRGPKIIFCSGIDLTNGDLSSKVFLYLCNDEKTTVILTEKPSLLLALQKDSGNSMASISKELYNNWVKLAKSRTGKATDGVAVPLETVLKLDQWMVEEEVTGEDLINFRNEITAKRKEKLIAKVRDQKIQNLLNTDNIEGEDSSDDDDDDDDDDDNNNNNNNNNNSYEGVTGLKRDERKAGEIFDQQVKKGQKSVISNNDKAYNINNNNINNNNNLKNPRNNHDLTNTSSVAVTAPTVEEVDELIQHEAFIMDYIKQSMAKHLPIDIKVTHKLKPRQAMFPYFQSSIAARTNFDDYGQIIDHKDFVKKDEISHSKIIMEGKRKFDERKQRGGRNQKYNTRVDNDEKRDKKNAKSNKLTPQEQVNQQLLHKYLDTLSKPLKRVLLEMQPSAKTQIQIRCGLAFVDLSGSVDMRSLGIIVQALKPYNLILLPDLRTSDENGESGLSQVEHFFQQQQTEQAMEHSKRQLFNSSRYLSLASIRDGLATAYSRGAGGAGGVGGAGNSNKMNVLVPLPDKPIKIGNDSESDSIGLSNFEVNLDDELVSTLKWKKVGDNYKVAKIYGELEINNQSPFMESQNSATGQTVTESTDDMADVPPTKKQKKLFADYVNSSTQFSLKPVDPNSTLRNSQNSIINRIQDPKLRAMISNASPKLAIGNVRLPDLKNKLLALTVNNQPLKVEFKSEGTLVVNGQIAIRKISYSGVGMGDAGDGDESGGDIVIDGNIGPLYYRIKEVIREMLAYV